MLLLKRPVLGIFFSREAKLDFLKKNASDITNTHS